LPTNKKVKREALFNYFAKNLNLYFPTIGDTFPCPVCEDPCGREALNSNPPQVALAHLVPEPLGGRAMTLGCRIYESSHSAALNRDVADEKKLHEWNDGKGTHDVHVRLPEGNVSLEMSKMGRSWRVDVVSDRSNPRAREAMLRKLKSGKLFFTGNIRTFHSPHRNLSYLYHAFLVMFDHFGYEYVLSPHLDRVRSVLLEEESPNLSSILRSISDSDSNMPTITPSVNLLWSSSHPACFCVAFPPLMKKEKARCVILPGLSVISETYFSSLVDVPERFSGQMRFSFVPKRILKPLDDRASKGQAHELYSAFDSDRSVS